ncbi:MAG: hypothetical protein HUU35_12770, partial [Armatimonadetes bacterium]|nr:hypothetical protein [Armatimonadota bacterium]
MDIRERWGTVLVEVTPDAVSVGFDLQYPRRWPAAWLLPLMISAGDLPLQLDEDDGRLVLRHRHDSQLLYTPNSEAVRLSDWRCRLPGETVAGIVARAKRILEVVATGAVRSFWDLDAPEGETANHASHLALWEHLAGAGTGTERYSVLLGLGLTALNSLDELREFPGRWTACTWLASVDLRDEDGMPLGLADDPMAPCFINFGIETSRAGHRLLLESDAPFDLAALSALTGLSFQ